MRRRGFTLLELMVVLIIISAVMTISIPRLSDMFEVTLKSAMRKMAGAVQFCFNESVIKQTPLRLNFDIPSGQYWVSYLAVQNDTGEFVESPGSLIKREHLPKGVFITDIVTPHDIEKRVDGEDIYIGFYPTGYAERATIHLASRDGREYTLVIKPLTGKVQILEGYVDIVETGTQLQNSSSAPSFSVGFQ